MHLDGKQIAAAMSLADITQEQLRDMTTVAQATISKIIKGGIRPRAETLHQIQTALESKGIEFLDNSGVRLRPRGIEVLSGQEGLQKFFTGVFEHLKKYGGEVVQIGVKEPVFREMLGEEFSVFHVNRMADLVNTRQDIRVRAIICEGDTDVICDNYNEYRWISADIFSPVPFYIYGECLAIMDFETTPEPTIILHTYSAIANAYRKQFEAFWRQSKDITKVKKTSATKRK